MTKVTLVAKPGGTSPWHHARGASPTRTGCGIEFTRGNWHVVTGMERYTHRHSNRPVCGFCLDWSFLVPIEGQTDDLTERDRVHMLWRPDVATDGTGAWRVRTDDYGWWLDQRGGGCRAWGVSRKLTKPEAQGLMNQVAKKTPGALDYRDSNGHGSDMAPAIDTKETNDMALNLETPVSYTHAVTKARKIVGARSGKDLVRDGIVVQDDEHDGGNGKWYVNENAIQDAQLSAARASRELGIDLPGRAEGEQILAEAADELGIDIHAADAATGATESRESTEEEQDMAKSADKTTTRSRAAGTKTKTRSSGTSGSKNATAAMQTAADKVDTKALHDELLKKIKSSVRGVTAKASPKGSYTTIKVGVKPVAYLNPRAKAVVIHLGLTEKPEDVKLDMQPYSGNGPRFALQTKVTTTEQIEEALKAIEAAAVLVAK